MIVVSTPSQDLALTNFSYCSPGDLRKFATSGSKYTLVIVGDFLVLSLSSHTEIYNGQIALNAIQRRNTRVSAGDQISVMLFFPPDDFNLALLTVEVDYINVKANQNEQLDAVILAQHLRKKFINQVITTGQRVSFEFLGVNYIFTVNQAMVEWREKSNSTERGLITNDTYIVFEVASGSGIKIINQRESASSNIFSQKEFNLLKLGIGGLSEQFFEIFRRAIISRLLPPHVANKLGLKHVKGMLLHGRPGTGKTLMARQIVKLLHGREPKIVNAPEVLSKFVGEIEKTVQDLFADAEQDKRARGDQSDLHVIIFDEIDAICKDPKSSWAVRAHESHVAVRGPPVLANRQTSQDGTSVHDRLVNQLLNKIDGVESLNNVLLIGMTNRKI